MLYSGVKKESRGHLFPAARSALLFDHTDLRFRTIFIVLLTPLKAAGIKKRMDPLLMGRSYQKRR
jgi:hypothetical protein